MDWKAIFKTRLLWKYKGWRCYEYENGCIVLKMSSLKSWICDNCKQHGNVVLMFKNLKWTAYDIQTGRRISLRYRDAKSQRRSFIESQSAELQPILNTNKAYDAYLLVSRMDGARMQFRISDLKYSKRKLFGKRRYRRKPYIKEYLQET